MNEKHEELTVKTFTQGTWDAVEEMIIKYEVGKFDEEDHYELTVLVRRLVAESKYYEKNQ